MSHKIQLAIATILTQLSNIILMLSVKFIYEVDSFAEFILLISTSGILASFAFTKIEVMLFQKIKLIDKGFIECIFLTSIIVLSIFSLLYLMLTYLINIPKLSISLFIYCIFLVMTEIQSFLSVQLSQFKKLLISRFLIFLLTVGLGIQQYCFEFAQQPIDVVILTYSLIVLVPLVFDLYITYISSERVKRAIDCLYEVKYNIKRMIYVSASSGVNYLYLSLPIFVADHLRMTVFISDFGFISRFFTGSVTIIRMVYGQIFIAKILELQIERKSLEIMKHYYHTIARSSFLFLFFSVPIVIIFYYFADYLNIIDKNMILILFIVSFFQSFINPLANVRVVSGEEGYYFILDTMRVTVLYFFLIFNVGDFGIRYVIGSSLLYLIYFFYIHRSIKLLTISTRH